MSAESTSATVKTIDDAFRSRLAKFVGQGEDRPGATAREPISATAIRQMTDAVGDRNPAYTDEAFAQQSIHRGIVAPPLWLYTWMMPGLEPEAEQAKLADGTHYFHLAPAGQRRTTGVRQTIRDELNDLLEEYGYSSPAVTNMSYTYVRYLRPGETPRFSSWIIDDIAGPKETKLGEGFFASMRMNVFVADELVATIRQRYLRSKPRAKTEPAKVPSTGNAPAQTAVEPPPPVLRYETIPKEPLRTLRFEEVKAGDALPPLVVKISPTLIIAGALASRDFQDVHHDYQIISRRGHPNIFMNMMTSSGLIGRFITDWSGPEALIREHELRLSRPNYAGDTMRLVGTVRATEDRDGRGLVTVDVVGTNSLGKHVESSVVVELAR